MLLKFIQLRLTAHYSGPAVDYGAPSSHGYDSYGAHSAPGPDYYAPTGYYGKPSGGYSSHKHHPYEGNAIYFF